MSSGFRYGRFEEDEELTFAEAFGDVADENRVELAEQALDREEARDTFPSTPSGIPRSAHPADMGNAFSSAARARSRTGVPNASAPSGDQNDPARVRSNTSAPGQIATPDIPSRPIPIPQRRTSAGLRQTYFDVQYGEGWVQCKECDKFYDSSSQRGRIGHDAEHNKRINSKVTKKEMSTVVLAEWESDEKKHRVVVIDCKQTIAVRNHAQAILALTSEALGQIHVGSDALWSEMPDPQSIQRTPPKVPRFRVFVHYINDMAAAAVLAERIRDACSYHPGRTIREDGGPLIGEGATVSVLEDPGIHTTYHVWASIERIWVHPNYRRQGFATRMVDFVRENFIRGLPLSKSDIAFSCPFGTGVAFATNYCQEVFGDILFLVNADEVIR
jgi:ribosomal protein S18 acetylase RimI-like enzyme